MYTLPSKARFSSSVGNGLFNSASLDLHFAKTKSLVDATTGSNLVDFTRASSGTYVGSDGLIKTATTNEPRFDHDPVTGESLGLLVEESRTNLLTYSEDFENVAWQTTNPGEVTLIAGVSDPAGGNNATTLYHDSGAGDTGWLRRIISGTSGQPYTLSFWARRRIGTGDLIAVVGNNVNQTINGVTSNWQRFSIVNTPTSSLVRSYLKVDSPGDQFDIWGAQLEAGSFSTSYIPTTSSTVTRAADVASISGSNFSSWYRQDEGTVLADASVAYSAINSLFSLDDSTIDNRIQLRSTNLSADLRIVTAGADQSTLLTSNKTTPGTRARYAGSYNENDLASVLNGGAAASQATASIPVATQAVIGTALGSSPTNGRIRRLTYWPQRLPNATLQTITQ